MIRKKGTDTAATSSRLHDATGSPHIIECLDLKKSFGETEVLKGISFYIRNNEFLTLLGPSGCGKTTTLRILGGFEEADAGEVSFEGHDLLELPPHKRQLNTVFQRFALFPFLNVFDNVAFGLNIKKRPAKEIEQLVRKALRTVDLEGYETREIDQLSGGQMQRIAIARAIVNQPKVLLLDEPLGALDLKMRKEMQVELKQMQRDLGITFVYVTHDQEEALTMSDTIIVMKNGYIQQVGTPADIYNEPRNAFVADFIGESNIIPGLMLQDREVEIEGRLLPCVDPRKAEDQVDVVIRPEDIDISEPTENLICGTVESVVFKGVHYEMLIESDGGFEWMVQSTDKAEAGSRVGLRFGPDDIHIMAKSAFSPDAAGPDSISRAYDTAEGGEGDE
ncbi:ABC transporter ATP-binding protein [Oscillospiraceae bacterium HV4-5-C5C]|nr:ABC transporter ATP-binding protein [Oscillospiraceae bacterium HV4-5-C5C]